MITLQHPIRLQVQAYLPEKACLQRDRGGGLYVTRECERIGALAAEGFRVEKRGQLLVLTPEACWAGVLTEWLDMQSGFMREMEKLRLRDALPEDRELWIRAVKLLEDGNAAENYEKALRQRAAVCLRRGEGGGLLHDCAACLAYVKGESAI